jgi:hypothetical protein
MFGGLNKNCDLLRPEMLHEGIKSAVVMLLSVGSSLAHREWPLAPSQNGKNAVEN